MDPFIAEIRIYPFNFAPKGWAWCNGQLLPISQNTALFSLLGTFYGGDGKSTFALPDMQGNMPMHHGQGAGLSLRDLGEMGGSETVTLLESEIPVHTHLYSAHGGDASTASPSAQLPAKGYWDDGTAAGMVGAYSSSPPNTAMSPYGLAAAGGSLPHNNMMPYLALSFCIALTGVFPARW